MVPLNKISKIVILVGVFSSKIWVFTTLFSDLRVQEFKIILRNKNKIKGLDTSKIRVSKNFILRNRLDKKQILIKNPNRGGIPPNLSSLIEV